MNCDLCGSERELYSAIVENSLMSVCKNCLRFGKKVERNKDFDFNNVIKRKAEKEDLFLLKENYNLIIKEQREKLKLTQEELAKKLNEKFSLIHKVENKEIVPDDNFVKKIENFFNIKLYETYREENKVGLNFQSSSLTIGDLLNFGRLKKVRK